LGTPRKQFADLHFRYEPVPEICLSRETFDRFSPPRRYLSQLHDALSEVTDPDIFLEALGCHIVPNDREREEISSRLSVKLPPNEPQGRRGLVLICWERIATAAKRLGLGDDHLPLLEAVCFHEHSHSARESSLLRTGDAELLRREETVAQHETYLFLRSQGKRDALEAMKRLMYEQPECYRIPIP
jgi:hypothetical protein